MLYESQRELYSRLRAYYKICPSVYVRRLPSFCGAWLARRAFTHKSPLDINKTLKRGCSATTTSSSNVRVANEVCIYDMKEWSELEMSTRPIQVTSVPQVCISDSTWDISVDISKIYAKRWLWDVLYISIKWREERETPRCWDIK